MLRIDEIELTNFKNYDTLKANFSEGVNLFVGENGSGKTSLLEAICVAVGGFFQEKDIWLRQIGQNEVRITKGKRMQSVKVASSYIINGEKTNWTTLTHSIDNGKLLQNNGQKSALTEYGCNTIDGFSDEPDNNNVAPILAYYSTQRLISVPDLPEEIRKLSTQNSYDTTMGRRNGYLNWYGERGIKDVLLDWFKNAVTRRATHLIKKINATDTVLENVEFVVKETLIQFLGLPKDFPLKIYAEPDYGYQLFLNYDNQHDVPLTYYSDGFKNLLFLIIDLVWRASQLNPWMQWEELSAKISGVVMIDEIDLHLHPRWQAKAIPWLQYLFPNVQFFITTHSPTVIANFKIGSLYRLENNIVERVYEKHFGKEVNYIITNILGADERNVGITAKLGTLYSLIDDDLPENRVAIEKQLAELSEILGDTDPDIQKAKAMIAWNKYKNEDTDAVH